MEQPKSIFKTQPITKKSIARDQRLAKYTSDMSGTGQYVFENNIKADLFIPNPNHPNKVGNRVLKKGERFVGDSYYFQMVRKNELKFIQEVDMKEERLITEQPPTVTTEGTVEYVKKTKEENLNEQQDQTNILLTENPIDGITILS